MTLQNEQQDLLLTYVAQLDKSLLSKSRCCLDPLQSWKCSSAHNHPKKKWVRMILETRGFWLARNQPPLADGKKNKRTGTSQLLIYNPFAVASHHLTF